MLEELAALRLMGELLPPDVRILAPCVELPRYYGKTPPQKGGQQQGGGAAQQGAAAQQKGYGFGEAASFAVLHPDRGQC